jgi:hypothetical protein
MKNIQLSQSQEAKSTVQRPIGVVKKNWTKPEISEISRFMILGGGANPKVEASVGGSFPNS